MESMFLFRQVTLEAYPSDLNDLEAPTHCKSADRVHMRSSTGRGRGRPNVEQPVGWGPSANSLSCAAAVRCADESRLAAQRTTNTCGWRRS